MSGFSREKLMHDEHDEQDQQQVQREQPHGDMVGNEPEDRRHDTGADIGAGHLNSDDCLGFIRTEVCRCGMDDTGIHRSASQSDQDQPGQ